MLLFLLMCCQQGHSGIQVHKGGARHADNRYTTTGRCCDDAVFHNVTVGPLRHKPDAWRTSRATTTVPHSLHAGLFILLLHVSGEEAVWNVPPANSNCSNVETHTHTHTHTQGLATHRVGTQLHLKKEKK